MTKGISGTAVAATTAGALLLWSGVKGRSWSMVVRELIAGNQPGNSQENPIASASGGGGSSGTTSPGATTPNLSGNKKIVNMTAASYGWGSGAEWAALVNLVNSESHFDNNAQNPTSTAYGIFQFLDGTWKDVGGTKTSDPTIQAQLGMKYIKMRYGDPIKAWAFHLAHGWY